MTPLEARTVIHEAMPDCMVGTGTSGSGTIGQIEPLKISRNIHVQKNGNTIFFEDYKNPDELEDVMFRALDTGRTWLI